MNQAWEGEPLDLLTVEGYRITVGAKPLHVVDETFCLIPTDDAKCQYLIHPSFGASAGQREPGRKREKGYRGGVLTASPMLKLAKMMEKIRKPIGVDRIAYFFPVGGFSFILEYLLDFWKDNHVISVIESLLPYQKPILRYFWRDNIFDLMIKFDFPYQRPIPLFSIIVMRCSELRDPWMNIL